MKSTLIDAAISLLEEKGLDPLTLRRLASSVGVSAAAVYHHFKDKGALLAAVAEEGFDALAGMMEIAARRERGPQDRLEAIGRAYVKFAIQHRAYFQVMFGSSLEDYWQKPPLRDKSLAAFNVLHDAVRATLPKKSQHHSRDLALFGWSAVHGLASLWLDGPISRVDVDERSIDQLARLIAHLATNAITPS